MSNIISPSERNPLVSYPKQAEFGRVLPKNKIYEHGAVKTRLKERFVEQVEQIVWQFKLAPETINLPAKPGVPEIQVFRITLKGPELDEAVLQCIDDAVQFPLLFELEYQGKVRMVATYKRPSEADSGRWVTSEYFWGNWQPTTTERNPLPAALDLSGLYAALLKQLIPLTPRQNEALQPLVERYGAVKAAALQIEQLKKKLEKEKQFNRKVEINSHLKALKEELCQLGGDE